MHRCTAHRITATKFHKGNKIKTSHKARENRVKRGEDFNVSVLGLLKEKKMR